VLSAVNGVATLNALYAIVGLVVKQVVLPIFISNTVLPLVLATVPIYISAQSTLYGLSLYQALAISVPVAPNVPAIANLATVGSIKVYLNESASGVASIVSHTKVIVVSGSEYVEGILTIAICSVVHSNRLIIIPFLNIAVKSVATVQVVVLTFVAVTAVRTAVQPQPQPAAFNVVPLKLRLVHNVISSITPVPAVPLPNNLSVAIESIFIVQSASGKVNVLSAVVGHVNLVNPFPVPPNPEAIICVNAALPSKLLPYIALVVANFGAATIVITGVLVQVATVALASAELTSVTVQEPAQSAPL